MDGYNLVSLAGLFVLMGAAWLVSTDRRRLNWRCIAFGLGIQLLVGAVVFWDPASRDRFLWLNTGVLKLLAAASEGQKFVFGSLATPPGQEGSPGFILAIQALPLIIFFSALMALLYHWRIMPAIIRGFAWVFTRLMRISGAESLCAASNIFVGVESATIVRPYLGAMTRSELCTILTVGMATVASSTLAVYVMYLSPVFGTIAGHLISASVISAPAAIVMSKILMPETQEPLTLGRTVRPEAAESSGAIDSIIGGAMAGVKLVVGICALLIAFLGLIAVVDLLLQLAAAGAEATIEWLGAWSGAGWQVEFDWSLGRLLGYMMWPLAVVMGVPPADAYQAGSMLGERLVATEIPAYIHLAEAMKAGSFTHQRTPMVLAYALCGFAHVASLAIFVGGIAAIVPERRKDLAAVGPRALLAATLACLMTGAVAGVFFRGGAGMLQAAGP